MLMLVCPCGNEGPFPEESCSFKCSKCGIRHEVRFYVDGQRVCPGEPWQSFRDRQAATVPAKNLYRIEWRGTEAAA